MLDQKLWHYSSKIDDPRRMSSKYIVEYAQFVKKFSVEKRIFSPGLEEVKECIRSKGKFLELEGDFSSGKYF